MIRQCGHEGSGGTMKMLNRQFCEDNWKKFKNRNAIKKKPYARKYKLHNSFTQCNAKLETASRKGWCFTATRHMEDDDNDKLFTFV